MTDRKPNDDAQAWLALLKAEPARFDFFQAVRILEAAHPQRVALGRGRRSAEETVRLSQPPFLTHPPGDLAGLEQASDSYLKLSTYLFGLFGPQGPLPIAVTAHARARARQHGDPTFAHFADIFHHRMIALFYRAWAAARPAIEHDRGQDGRFRERVAGLIGIGPAAFRDRQPLPDRFLLHIAGLALLGSHPPEALERALQLFFRVPARIVELVGAWLDIPPHCWSRLGAAQLGHDAVLGKASFQRTHRFRVRLGPLGLPSFMGFLPVGAALPVLTALVRSLQGLEHDWDLQLVLAKAEVPTARLGDPGTRLGWTSWLGSRERLVDADDLVLARLA